jgi:flagellar biosynthesis protein FliR
MKAVPSINVFSVGMQLMALIGILIILITMTSIVTMCGQLISFMLEKAAEVVRLIGTGT